MKAAVAYLEPLMEKVEGSTRGTMILATVKGDVHDIGKNLVDIILTNNGYRVINLGIKQPIDNIINAAIEHKADCIGMSGLLVKSTVIMKENLDILNQREIALPVILGGAALTRRYVEDDCRRVYKGLLFYGQDAFDDLHIMEALASKDQEHIQKMLGKAAPEKAYADDGDNDEDERGEENGHKDGTGVSTAGPAILRSDVARGLVAPKPPFWGAKAVDDFDLAEVFQYLNENALIKGQFRVRQGDTPDGEYQKMLDEKVRPMLSALKEKCIHEKLLTPKAVYGYFPCQSQGDDLIVYHPFEKEPKAKEWVRFKFPRQDFGRGLCISDFFASVDEGFDVLAAQIATVGDYATTYAQELFAANKYSDYLYFHGLAVESAEAVAELLHKRIRSELSLDHLDAADRSKFFQQGYSGTRYSFGYPACPNLEDQVQLFELLKPGDIGIELSEEYQLVPEQSTSAIIVVHPEAKYFNVKRRAAATT
jgi:5-methyltetrahydrofolate--homocysteine methyltransferase